MITEFLGQAEYVTVGQPIGRYWVYDVNAPGGQNFETVRARPGVSYHYSDLEIALMAQHPNIFSRSDLTEDQMFVEARTRAMQPGIKAGIVPVEPDQIQNSPSSMQTIDFSEYALPVAAGAGAFSLLMGDIFSKMSDSLERFRQRTVQTGQAAIDVVRENVPAPAATGNAYSENQIVSRTAIIDQYSQKPKIPTLAWPIAAGVLMFSLVGIQ